MATLIALAQEQRWQSEQAAAKNISEGEDQLAEYEGLGRSSKRTTSFTVRPEHRTNLLQVSNQATNKEQVRLLAILDATSRALYAYKASFSAAFLDKLELPSRFSASEPVQISYYKLSMRKPEVLIKSLTQVLDLTPDQDCGDMETEGSRFVFDGHCASQ